MGAVSPASRGPDHGVDGYMTELKYKYYGDKFVKRPKYSNRSCQCWNKKHAPHQSILEADLCNQLNAMQRSGEIINYISQYKIEIKVNGVHICNHYVDFFVLCYNSVLRKN